MRRVAALLAVCFSGCNVLIPLDDLDAGDAGAGGGASSTTTGSSVTTGATGTSSVSSSSSGGGGDGGHGGGGQGGDAVGGGGGAGPRAYAELVLSSAPLLYLRLGEPTGSSVARDEPGQRDGTYQPGATLGLPGALVGDPSTAVRPAVDTAPRGAVTLGDVLDFDGDPAPSFTLECWVRVLDAPGDAPQFLLSKDDRRRSRRLPPGGLPPARPLGHRAGRRASAATPSRRRSWSTPGTTSSRPSTRGRSSCSSTAP